MKWLLPLLLAGCVSADVGDGKSVAVRTVYALSYCGASGSNQSIERIRDLNELHAAWLRHNFSQMLQASPPVVDFTRRHLALIALGQRPTAGYGLELASARGELRDRVLSIEIRRQQPAADSITAQVLTSPCLMIEIDAGANQLDEVVVRESSVSAQVR